MTKLEEHMATEIGEFIWDGFCDPAGVGVNIFNILDGAYLVGVHLTDEQKNSVLNHANAFDEWNTDDEEIRDLIAAATDCKDYEKMFSWLAFIVGDTTADDLAKEWELEAEESFKK